MTKRRLPVLDASVPAVDTASDPIERGFAEAQAGRRAFLEAATVAGASALVAGCSTTSWESFARQHYRRLDTEGREALIASVEAEARARQGLDVNVSDPQAIEGVEFGYALSLSACTGCRQCEYACAAENNTSRSPEMHYITVLELDIGSFELDEAERGYEGSVPREGRVYMPVSCQQCANPPCVSACPVDATWRESDGIIVVDYDWCIGCRYCETACPYGARHFNFRAPVIRPSEVNPDQGLLSNRIRPAGVMEKCHFCLHRTRRGELPACQEACPAGARVFGNLLDPNSPLRRILETKRVYVLREELGTSPRFFYYFD